MNALRRYGALLAPYRNRYLAGLSLLLATNALSLTIPWLVKGSVDAIAAMQAGRPVEGWLTSPWHFVGALVVIALVLAVIRTASRVVILGAGRYVARDVRERLYQRLLEADPSFYSRFPTGEIMSRGVSDVRMLEAVGAPGVLWGCNALFMFAIALPPMLSVSPLLTGLVLIPHPLLAGVTMWAATRVKRYSREAQEAMAELTTHLQETLEGMHVVKAFTLEEQQAARFEDANDRYLERSMKEALTRGGIGIVAVFAAGFGTCAILWAGGRAVAQGTLTYGDLALFLSLNAMVLRPTIYLGWILSLLQRGLAALDRVDELLLAPLAVRDPEEPKASGALEGRLEVEGLTYRYPAGAEGSTRRLALDDVSFTVPPGGVLGLTGPIGSGKSTILRAIPRFLEVPAESVRMDGVPIERWDLGDLRRGIGYVPQDGTVFSLSLGANIAFGEPDASEAEVTAALRAAELEKDLDQLDDGLETLVGERGVTLSGGQRQRLAIARALLIKPRVLLLDDALSMVDAETAVAILANLRERLPGTTVVVSAHRTATLLGADELLVVDRGRVVERGAPDELLSKPDSRFFAMHERQRLQSEILESA